MPGIYDAIVVGAGPAGSSAAYFLGEAGKHVLVLEKESLPRYKPCGGGLSARLLEQFPFSFDPVIESRVRAISYALGGQTFTVPLSGRPVYMVMRDRFDAHILAHARAEVRQGTTVRSVTEAEDRVLVETRDGQRFEGRYLIGADGANSVVARAVGLRRGKVLAAAIEAEVPVPPAAMHRFVDVPLFIFGEVQMGYLWIFPKRDHLSVGIGALHPERGQLRATLARVMARYGVSVQDVHLYGHPLPIYTRREPVATARTLLVGDAAGLVDPLTGEGIRFGIKSGRLAAEAILAGRPNRYLARIYRQIGLNHSLGLGLAWLFYHFPRASFELGVRNPFATRAFVDLLSDRAGYAGVILRLLGTQLIYLPIEALSALVGLLGGPERQHWVRSLVYPRLDD